MRPALRRRRDSDDDFEPDQLPRPSSSVRSRPARARADPILRRQAHPLTYPQRLRVGQNCKVTSMPTRTTLKWTPHPTGAAARAVKRVAPDR
jgi:hypothetical protein